MTKISELPSTVLPSTTHELPSSKDGASVKLTVQQIIDLARVNIAGSAPGALDTLDELAAAIGDDPNFVTTVSDAIAAEQAARISADDGKQPLDAMLTALAALTTDSNQFLAFEGADDPVARAINGAIAGSYSDPTGALMEYGSNGNGQYFRFANGLQICVQAAVASSTVSITNSYTGGLFVGTASLLFPAAFSTQPFTIGKAVWGSGASWVSNTVSTLTSLSMVLLDSASRSSGTATSLGYIAAGRWQP